MTEEMSLSEFSKLSLEERAKIVLKNHYEGKKMKADGTFLLSLAPLIETWNYLEKNDYVMLTGGTPKSGASYGITDKGLLFMNN
jgi:hypothetical protein